jgi:T-complex protein 1 subunit beta
VDGVEKVADLEEAEKAKMKKKVDSILSTGCNVFINRQLIYNYPESLFAHAGVSMIEHADFEGIERLALVTGGEIASSFQDPAAIKMGRADLVEEIMIGEDRLIRIQGVANAAACTVVLRGATHNILEEAERSLHDALSVLSQTVLEPRIILGGGCAEMLMANKVDDLAMISDGKESIAIAAFASALRALPTIIADNGGYDSSELIANLRAAHRKGETEAGLNMYEGKVGNVKELGIT